MSGRLIMKEKKFFVELTYKDDSTACFNVEVSGTDNSITALLMMITRGTLMASSAVRATCYREDGFDVCSYIR